MLAGTKPPHRTASQIGRPRQPRQVRNAPATRPTSALRTMEIETRLEETETRLRETRVRLDEEAAGHRATRARLEEEIAARDARVAKLEARLRRNSGTG